MKKILIIGPSWIGDMIMAQSLFKLLKKNQACEIDVLAPSWTFDVLSLMPEVRKAIELPFGHGEFNLRKRIAFGKQLKQEKYNQAIILPNSFKSALIPFFANIPLRTAWRGEMRYGLVNDLRVLDKKKYPKMIERFAALAYLKNLEFNESIPLPSLKINKDRFEIVKYLEKDFKINIGKPILAICPGAEYGPSKRWSHESFAKVANDIINKGYQVWLFGSKKDIEFGDKIISLIEKTKLSDVENFIGKTSLKSSIEFLSLSNVILTNDSGLMHIGAALDIPLVAIYGSTTPEFTPPLSDKAKIVKLDLKCSPCFSRTCPYGHYDCMNKLFPENIISLLDNIDKSLEIGKGAA